MKGSQNHSPSVTGTAVVVVLSAVAVVDVLSAVAVVFVMR